MGMRRCTASSTQKWDLRRHFLKQKAETVTATDRSEIQLLVTLKHPKLH